MTMAFILGSVGRKIGLGFLATLACTFAAVGCALWFYGAAQDDQEAALGLSQHEVAAASLNATLAGQGASLWAYAVTGDAAHREAFEASAPAVLEGRSVLAEVDDPEVRRLVEAAVAADEQHDAIASEKLFPSVEAGDEAGARAAAAESDAALAKVSEAHLSIERRLEELATAAESHASAASDTARRMALMFGALAALMTVVAAHVRSGARSQRSPIAWRFSSGTAARTCGARSMRWRAAISPSTSSR